VGHAAGHPGTAEVHRKQDHRNDYPSRCLFHCCFLVKLGPNGGRNKLS
jgi:hypothetical protein